MRPRKRDKLLLVQDDLHAVVAPARDSLTPISVPRGRLCLSLLSHVLSSVPDPGLLRLRHPEQPRSVCELSAAPIALILGLGTVRKLNSVLFPIKYSEKFYSDIVQPNVEDFCQLSACDRPRAPYSSSHEVPKVYYNDIPIGTMCCRLEVKDDGARLYLMTLGVLAVSDSSYVWNLAYADAYIVAVSLEGCWITKSATSHRRSYCTREAKDHRNLSSCTGLKW